nr:hypothetical protein [Pandoravirus belohorizontensis]
MDVSAAGVRGADREHAQEIAALECCDWLALACDRQLVLRSRDYAAFTPGKAMILVPIDRVVSERRDGIARGTAQLQEAAAAFFGASIEVVVPTGRAWLERDGVRVAMPAACLAAHWTSHKETLAVSAYRSLARASDERGDADLGDPSGDAHWHSEAGESASWLCSGSGDRQTRYMRWRDVMDMPPVRVCPRDDDHGRCACEAIQSALRRSHGDGDDGNRDYPMSPRVIVAAEAERLLADAVARRAVCDEACLAQEITPVWLDDAVSYLDHL